MSVPYKAPWFSVPDDIPDKVSVRPVNTWRNRKADRIMRQGDMVFKCVECAVSKRDRLCVQFGVGTTCAHCTRRGRSCSLFRPREDTPRPVDNDEIDQLMESDAPAETLLEVSWSVGLGRSLLTSA